MMVVKDLVVMVVFLCSIFTDESAGGWLLSVAVVTD